MLYLQQVLQQFPEARETPGKNGLEYNCHCPQPHKKGGIYKLYINAEDGVFVCQDCGFTGNAYNVWFDDMEAMFPQFFPNRQIVQHVVKRSNIRRGGVMWTPDVPAPGQCVPFSSLPEDHLAVQYLKSRDFNTDELRQLDDTRQIWYCLHGQYSFPQPNYLGSTSGRLIFPLYMLKKMVGWQARQIDYVLWETETDGEKKVWNGTDWRIFKKIEGHWEDKDVPKYYNSPQIPRRNSLFGFDMATSYKEVAVVEGALDYHKTGPQCVGLLGGDGIATFDQCRLLSTCWNVLYWILDPNVNLNNEKTKRRWDEMMKHLVPAKVHVIRLENGKDPGAAPNREYIWSQIGSQVVSSRQHKPGVN